MATECTKEIVFHVNKAEVLDIASSLVASRHRQHQSMTGPEEACGGGARARGLVLQRQCMLVLSALFC